MHSAGQQSLPSDVRHHTVAALLIGAIRVLRDIDGEHAGAGLRVSGDDVVVFVRSFGKSLRRGGGDKAEPVIAVVNVGVFQQHIVEQIAHPLCNPVRAEHDVDELTIKASAVLDVLPLVLLGQIVDMVFQQRIPLALSELGQGDELLSLAGVSVAVLRALELPRHGLRIERTNVAGVGGIRLLTQILLVGVNDSST